MTYLPLILWLAKWWLIAAVFVNEMYGLFLLLSREDFRKELTQNAVTGEMFRDIMLAPLVIGEVLLAGFFYPVKFYAESGRARKTLNRTQFQGRTI